MCANEEAEHTGMCLNSHGFQIEKNINPTNQIHPLDPFLV